METIKLMINGLPGNVAQMVAKHALRDERFELVPFSLTGPDITATEIRVAGQAVRLVPPDAREAVTADLKGRFPGLLTVDYTHPAAVNANAAFYCRQELPFVMGTTGGDREKLAETVTASAIPAVIAPNMAREIVGFQAMMAYAADTFPGLFKGYRLSVKESHQKGKADTSGTAKAMIGYFNRLGIPFSADEIVKERDPEVQKSEWGVPEAYLGGHGWHTYTLDSADGTVRFSFTHNVNGREVYALGTLDAARFLAERVKEGARGRVYSMIDVLKGTPC